MYILCGIWSSGTQPYDHPFIQYAISAHVTKGASQDESRGLELPIYYCCFTLMYMLQLSDIYIDCLLVLQPLKSNKKVGSTEDEIEG